MKGCGSTVAHKLTSCGHGDGLLRAARYFDDDKLYETYVSDWLGELQRDLAMDFHGTLGRCYESLSNIAMGSALPNKDVISAYSRPIISAVPFEADHVINNLGKKCIDLPRLSRFIQERLGWDRDTDALKKKFANLVWPGVVFRSMVYNFGPQVRDLFSFCVR